MDEVARTGDVARWRQVDYCYIKCTVYYPRIFINRHLWY